MATVELKSAPGSAGLYFKAALGMTPLAGGRKKELPDTVLSLAPKKVDVGQLQAFCRVAEHTNIGSLPPIYFNMLAFPLHMALLTSDGFPFPVIGLVHVQNKIDQVRPVEVGEELGLQVRAENLRAHAKGRQFDVISEARAGDELVSTATSTYLRIGGGGDKTETTDSGETVDYAALPHIAEWALPGDLGRRYASVSGDRNPIHMHNLSAKASVFRRRSPTACGRRRVCSPRSTTSCPTRSLWMSRSSARSCCRQRSSSAPPKPRTVSTSRCETPKRARRTLTVQRARSSGKPFGWRGKPFGRRD